MEKELRNLSGIYFRYKINGHFEPVCFEDLPEEEQDRILTGRSEEWIKALAKMLAKKLRELGDKFDIISGEEQNEMPNDNN